MLSGVSPDALSALRARIELGLEPELNTGCLLWARGRNNQGYGQTRVARRDALVHRVMWELAHGAIPPGLLVLHRCDTPACANPDHLFLGTYSDNTRDMLAKGRWSRSPRYGAQTGNAKLTDAAVMEIRRQIAGGARNYEVAARFAVGEATVSHIRVGRTWTHLPMPDLSGAKATTPARRPTHCKRGHAFDEANTMWSARGRMCRACYLANSRAAWARFRERSPAANVSNKDKTHCKRGHEFTPENTRLLNGGGRRCLACSREQARQRDRAMEGVRP